MKTNFNRIVAAAAVSLGLVPSISNAQVASYVGKQISAFDATSINSHETSSSVAAADALIDTLDAGLRTKALLPMTSDEWAKWSNLPPSPDYAGVRLADLSEAQLKLAFTLMATSISGEGFHKVKGIMLGDDLLVRGDGNQGQMRFGADNYWLIIFGRPDAAKPWGWQLDGHHLGLNVSIVGERSTIAPSFIGTQPADVVWNDSDSYTPMKGEVALAYELINSLNAEQRSKAVRGARRQNIDAGPGQDNTIPDMEGIAGSDLSSQQREKLLELISEWVRIHEPKESARRLKEVASDITKTHLAWYGETAEDSPVYYRIQGPRLLIEFSHQNLGGNPLQHLHSVYRDPTNDYGKALRN